MTTIRLITKDSGVGLRKDVDIIRGVLESMEGITVEEIYIPVIVSKYTPYKLFLQRNKRKVPDSLRRLINVLELYFRPSLNLPKVEVNIFLENIEPSYLDKADINILIPNQEWINDSTVNYLSWLDLVVCKTKYAVDVFKPLVNSWVYTSFTSEDKKIIGVQPDYNKLFHLAGGSLQKGTAPLVNAWIRNPQWPTLQVIQHPKNQQNVTYRNIDYLADFISDDKLKAIQNNIGCHLSMSEAEGFGHSLVEAMSAEGVVVTTDAPPMNEIVTNNHGILAAYEHTQTQRLGQNYMVTVNSVEKSVNQLLGMNDAEKKRLGKNAREWYLENDLFFRTKFVDVIKQII